MCERLLVPILLFMVLALVGNASAELVGHWEFDGDFAGVGGVGQTGEPFGNISFEDDPWRGQVLSLPGGDDQYVVLGSVGISGNMPKTIACWAKADHTNIPNWTLIFGFTGQEDGSGGNGSHFNIGSLGGPGGVGAHVWGWEETIFSDDEALEWHHYAMTYDGTTIQYYGDGQLMDTDTAKSNDCDLSASADRVHAGSRITQASSFPGKVDDARIYNTALTADEIPGLMGPGYPYPSNPNPADGEVEVDVVMLEWAAGATAVSHKVYLSSDATIDDTDLLGETDLTIQVVTVDPGATYFWRIDEVEADGNVWAGDVWTFSTIPLEAHFPSPADGAEGLEPSTTLSWTAGKIVIMHDVYLGTDAAAVEARHPSTFKGKLMDASYDPGELKLFTTYYWAVDQFAPPPTGTVAGPLWSFSTAEYVVVEAGEATLDYDNTAEPFVSELVLDVPANVTAGGLLSDVTLRFRGAPNNLSIDEATGTYEIAGAGADVWGSADQFHYVYRELTGDATMIARVVSNGTGSNNWAKGGVMVRQGLAPGSTHALMAITGSEGGGGAFQWRPAADGDSSSAHDTAAGMAPGYWVKIERVGNALSGSYSADGVTWIQQGDAQAIEMTDPVLIGLFVTSHQSGEIRTYTFDNVSIDGNVSADDMSADVDSVSGNSAEPVYVALEDMAGNVGVAAYPDPAATRIDQWWNMRIPIAELAAQGVDLTIASKLIFGVGSGAGGGAGVVTVADVKIVKPVAMSETGDVTAPGDNVVSLPFYNSPSHGREDPPRAIDDDVNAKYLNFEGAIQPSGMQIEPLVGPTIITGLTLTTANDSPERDPASFEIYGSNESINGPYELIAGGDVVDFIGADAWLRFTINATAIKFDNTVEYRFYQVLFPTVRDPGAADSMQIAEIELLAASGYAFEGDAPDDTWDHDNGSDEWDGTAPGEGMPGGAISLTEDDVTFLRIQDTGDPRDYGMSDPTNRKVYFTRLTDISLDGLTIEARIRVATTGALDDQHPDGGGGIAPWPAEGIGYHIRDGGKGMIGVSDGVGIISFSLAQAGEPDFPDATSDVLVMNSLVGTEPTSDVDTEDIANAVALNVMAIDDATQWNTFVINIVAGGAGTHVVTVSANGGPAESFDVTLGSDLEAEAPFIAVGSSGTGGITAFDVDYLSVSN